MNSSSCRVVRDNGHVFQKTLWSHYGHTINLDTTRNFCRLETSLLKMVALSEKKRCSDGELAVYSFGVVNKRKRLRPFGPQTANGEPRDRPPGGRPGCTKGLLFNQSYQNYMSSRVLKYINWHIILLIFI